MNILSVGHSSANREVIRAWLDAHKDIDPEDVVVEYEARGYLTTADAKALLAQKRSSPIDPVLINSSK